MSARLQVRLTSRLDGNGMKVKNYAIIGIAFVVLFVGVVLIGHATGFWHLPGQVVESEHSEPGETHVEPGETHVEPVENKTAEIAELHGYVNLKEWLSENHIDAECVAAKLGLKVEDLNVEARDIAHSKGMEPADIQKLAMECAGQGQAPSMTEDKVANVTPQTQPEQTAKIPNDFVNRETVARDFPKDPESKAEEIRKAFKGGIEITPPNGDQLPTIGFLQGTDNLQKYCIDNNVNMECLSEKIGVPVADFDNTAKEIASRLPGGHVEEIRKYLLGCVDYSR